MGLHTVITGETLLASQVNNSKKRGAAPPESDATPWCADQAAIL